MVTPAQVVGMMVEDALKQTLLGIFLGQRYILSARCRYGL